ncbi:MAG: ABC transporter ATP-binding protein [Oligosphaeraceae bacterium]|jgi:ABC-2 type transport system ATP-binding protein|nr:ABC transporter ATP-binding protein [Oligosphaeraceae bacterium]
MHIRISHLSRSFKKVKAVSDLSFEFSAGNVFGFIGPNGAGKTTTIKIMASMDMPDAGDVFFDDLSVVNYPEEVRKLIGYMPDALPGFADIQVWEYLDFFARSFGLQGRRRTQTLAEIEEFTSLGDIREKYIASLSKGMKQRVSLARALVHNPQVLIMDEPAAGLDPRARLELRSLLKILSSQGKAILLSSHILSELQDICDGAVIIEQGRLLSAGTIPQLLAQVRRQATPADNGAGAVSAGPDSPLLLVIRCLRDSEAVRLKLLEHPAVLDAILEPGHTVRAQVKCTDAEIPALMATLFAAGLPIIGFTRQELGLEELFMRITSGKVQ